MKRRILYLILAIMMLMNCNMFLPKTKAVTFTDVPETHWANYYIYEMQASNIINGYGDGTFLPEKQVKTGEFIKMLCMAIWPNFRYELDENAEHWAKPYVFALDNLMLDRREYGPKRMERIITREEAAELICSFVQLININSNAYKKLDTNQNYIKNLTDEDLITDEESRIYIDNCIKWGLINGFDDGTFKPSNGLTRAQAAKIIYNAILIYDGGDN